jgi:hypothetical protein
MDAVVNLRLVLWCVGHGGVAGVGRPARDGNDWLVILISVMKEGSLFLVAK